MAISYPLSLPDTSSFKEVRMMARTTDGVSASPFTFQQQLYKWSGEYWEADIRTVPMKRADAEEWISFLLKLKGMFGTFYLMPDPLGLTARGSCSSSAGTPVVDGAHSAQSNSLAISGATTGATGYFLAGDYISIGTGSTKQLFKVLSDANTDGGGDVTVDIFPSLRTALSGSESVTVSSPTGIFRLATNEMNWQVQTASIYGLSFSAIEAL